MLGTETDTNKYTTKTESARERVKDTGKLSKLATAFGFSRNNWCCVWHSKGAEGTKEANSLRTRKRRHLAFDCQSRRHLAFDRSTAAPPCREPTWQLNISQEREKVPLKV